MTKNELIQKWLQDDLNPDEQTAFRALEDYDALMKLSESLKHFKAPKFDEALTFEHILAETSKKPKSKIQWLQPILKIAAIMAISVGVYYYTTTLDTHISTLAAEKTTLELPDKSQITLNALSKITYNKKAWKTQRSLTLDGEAYFNVEKGSTFTVQTTSGSITVLGTEFLVENRHGIFEVICYEGAVNVITNTENRILNPGDQFVIIEGKIIKKEPELATAPAWITNESTFKSMPFKFVLSELERQYNVSITQETIDTETLFTGRFTHDNLDTALKAITVPLNINYKITNDLILLYEK